jgi:putative SOS response-associated peptidase YedK
MRWGLIPFYTHDIKTSGRPLINARAETITEKPVFRQSFERRRCLIPANSFFEWETLSDLPKSKKRKLRFGLKTGEPFAMAGIWDRWKSEENGAFVHSTCLLTCAPNELVGRIHDRMPVILRQDAEQEWLDENAKMDDIKSLCVPYDSRLMREDEAPDDVKTKPEKIQKAKMASETLSLFDD